MKKKQLVLILGTSLAAAVAVLFFGDSSDRPLIESLKTKVLPSVLMASAPESSPNNEDSHSPRSKEEEKLNLTPEFLTWFLEETKSIENSVKDPQILEEQLADKIKRFNSDEKKYLLQKLLDFNSSATAKILSVYLLSLGRESTAPLLEAYLGTPLVYVEGKTHSPEETLHMQEKAFRRSAIDALVEIARQDLTYRAKLQEVFLKISQSDLREYALKKLAETQ